MRIKVILALLLVPVAAMAGDFTSTGAGGGGWFHAGAIHPTDSTVIVIGGDVAGIYRTDNFGTTWYPWNEGLLNSDRLYTHGIEDLLAIDYDDWTGFFAATEGGIYCAEDDGDWETMTPVSTYGYRKSPGVTRVYPFPFSCLDWRGDSLVIAGAGRIWWDSDYDVSLAYEQGDYPALDAFYNYSDYDGQWTVWTLDLNDGDPTWEPDEDSEFGAARDITFATLDDTTYIAVGTSEGIYVRDPSGWTSVGEALYDDSLTCWSLHLTDRGTLYAGMGRTTTSGTTGVYRLFDIRTCTTWAWVGNDSVVDPWEESVKAMGGRPYKHLIYMSVVDGDSSDPDLLYLASRNNKYGLFRAYQPYDSDSLCTWRSKVYSTGEAPDWDFYYRDGADSAQDLPIGWLDYDPAYVVFQPVVSDSFPGVVALHLGGRLHVSADTGNSWTQCYTTGSDPWLTNGFKELGVVDMAFMTDGRLIESTVDCGLFRSDDEYLDGFEYLEQPSGDPSSSNNIPYNPQTGTVETRSDWRGSGEEAIIFISGDDRVGPCKLMWIDEDDDWHNLTCDLSCGNTYKFYDFIFTDDDTCFISYARYDAEVGTAAADLQEFGALRGRYCQGPDQWIWSAWNDSLIAIADTSYARGVDLLHHKASGRIFLAAEGIHAVLPGGQTWVPGGLYMLSTSADTTWELEFGGEGTDYQCLTCLAQSSAGDVVYAGSRGSCWVSIGTVFKCTNPADANSTTWIAMANTDATGYPFGFEEPEGTDWGDTTASKYLTSVYCLAVNPWDEDIVYTGFMCEGFAEQDGLWEYTPVGGWDKLSTGEAFDGINVACLAIKKKLAKAKLVVGTRGMELYYTTLDKPIGPLGLEKPGEERKISSGLRLKDIRTQIGGRTAINFMLEHPSAVKMKIYDVTGRLVHYYQADFGAGRGSIVWDGSSRMGRRCASGIYFMRLSTRDTEADSKFMLLR